MPSVLFIHGTGVRDTGLEEYVGQLQAGIGAIRPDYRLTASHWGDILGTSLLANGISIPSELSRQEADSIASRPLSDPGQRDPQTGLWEILDSAPLVELDALLAGQAHPPERRNEQFSRTLADRLGQGLETGQDLERRLDEAGLRTTAMAAATQLVASEQFADLASLAQLDAAVRSASLARAFVALAIGLRDEELGCPLPMSGNRREGLELATAQALAGTEVEPGQLRAQFKNVALEGLLKLLTNWAARNRLRLTRQAAPAAGDFVGYLVRGEPLRQLIRADLDGVDDEQVIIIAHSLGAMAAMDALITQAHRKVKMLICVATQSGLLFEMDTLPSIRFEHGYRLPADFPPTHFIYDPRDLLAYKAAGLFGSLVTDHLLDNRAPFPRNHGAYFANPELYQLLDRILPK